MISNQEKTKKRRNRRLLALSIAATLLTAPLAVSLPAGQANAAAASAKLKVISQPFNIEGVQTNIPAINKDGSTYIGVRSLNKSIGLTTDYIKATDTAKVTGHNRVLEIGLKNGAFTLNGQLIFGPEPIVQDNTTYLPLRYLLERMGYAISYDAPTKLIGIDLIQENELKIDAKVIAADGDGMSMMIHYPVISGFANAAVQEKINAFLKAEADKNAVEGQKQMDKVAEGNEQLKADNPDITIPESDFDGYYTVTYNEQGRLSLYVNYYIYTGGAHGMTARVPYNFDLATGDELSLEDVTEGNTKYVSIINDEIKKQIKSSELLLINPFETIEPDRDFFLNREGLVIYFTQYEYTSYASGMPEFVIPLKAFQ